MVKLEQALEMILEANPNKLITSVMDFEAFFGFCLQRPKDIGKLYGGGSFKTVMKSNGELSFFNPVQDFEIFKRGINRMKEAEEILKSKGKENLIVMEIEYEKPDCIKYIDI